MLNLPHQTAHWEDIMGMPTLMFNVDYFRLQMAIALGLLRPY